jgi:hypothetical protein
MAGHTPKMILVIAAAAAGCSINAGTAPGDGATIADDAGPQAPDVVTPDGGSDASGVETDSGTDAGADAGSLCAFDVEPAGVLAFGAVPVGQYRSWPVRLASLGNGECEIMGAFFGPKTGVWFSFGHPDSYPLKVPPGSIHEIQVACTPDATGPAPDADGRTDGNAVNFVRIVTDDPRQPGGDEICGGPGFCLRLDCLGIASKLVVTPRALDFGETDVECKSDERALTLRNNGTATLKVSGIEVVHDTEVGKFVVVDPPELPLLVPAATETTLKLFFAPDFEVPISGRLRVSNDAPNVPGGVVAVLLSGTGTPRPVVKDVFKVNYKPVVDVLVCTDVSASMTDQLDALQLNIVRFAEHVTGLNMSYQLGAVMSAFDAPAACQAGETSVPGVLHAAPGYPRIVASDPPNPPTAPYIPTGGDPAKTFAGNAVPGVCTLDGSEGCLEAIRLALSDPNINDEQANAGFLRKYSKLAVIIVSDGDDHSPDTVDAYAGFLKDLQGPRNKSLLSVSVVAPFDRDGDPLHLPMAQACAGDPTSEAPSRYLGLFAQIGNGVAPSICGKEWGIALQKLGLDYFPMPTEYYLSRPANPDTIVVTVNGIAVPEDPVNGYTYDPGTNAITFGSGAVPPLGATVEITYTVGCF